MGSPVLPLLKMMVAMSSTVGRTERPGQALEQANRCEDRQGESAQAGRGRDAGQDVFEDDHLDAVRRLELRFLEKGPAGDHRAEPRLGGRGFHAGRGRR